jgi:hypothetical protein
MATVSWAVRRSVAKHALRGRAESKVWTALSTKATVTEGRTEAHVLLLTSGQCHGAMPCPYADVQVVDRPALVELRAVRVRNFIEVPMLVVDRAEPEGVRVKTPKSDRSRRVPIAGPAVDPGLP